MRRIGLALNVFGQEDEAGTGAEDRQAGEDVAAHGLEQSEVGKQLQLCGRLATGQHEAVLGLVPVGQLPHLERLGTQRLQPPLMFNECPLQGHDSYSLHYYSPLSNVLTLVYSPLSVMLTLVIDLSRPSAP